LWGEGWDGLQPSNQDDWRDFMKKNNWIHSITGTKYDEQGYDWQGCNKNGEWLEGLGSIWDVVGICQ